MSTMHPGPGLALAMVVAAACGPAAPRATRPDAPAPPSPASASPPPAIDAIACPTDEALAALVRAESGVPAARLAGVTCVAVRLGGPRWFVEGWHALPPGDPDGDAWARVALLVEPDTRRSVWRDPYGGVGLVAPSPRRAAVDLDGDGHDELVVRRGYPEGSKSLAVERWDVDEGWIEAGRVDAACGVEWPEWRLVAAAAGPTLEVTCRAGASRYRWTGEALEARPGR